MNKTKTAAILGFGVLLLAVLTACEPIVSEPTGTVEVPLPEVPTDAVPDAGTGEVPEPTGDVQNVRVYLYLQDRAVTFGADTEYLEASTDLGQLVIEGLVPGAGYRLLLLIDSDAGSEFAASDYALSELFDVEPGVETRVEVSPIVNPFVSSTTATGNVVDVAVVDATLHAATSSTLYTGSFGSLAAASVPTGYQIRGLSVGVDIETLPTVNDELWLDTTRGVLPYDGTFETDYTAGFGEGTYEVSQSGALFDGTDGIAFFQGPERIGGAVITPGTDAGDIVWYQADLSQLDFFAGDPVSDFAILDTDGYFATVLGSFRLDRDLFEGLSPTENPDLDSLFAEAEFFDTAAAGLPNARIQSLGLSGSDIIIGTDRGAVIGQVVAGEDVYTGGEVIEATRNRSIRFVEVSGSDILLVSDDFIIYSRDGGASFSEPVPAIVGFDGTINGAVLGVGVAYLATSAGLVELALD